MNLLKRRSFLALAASGLAIEPLRAEPDQVALAIHELFGDREIQEGRVEIRLPPISENGYSVPFKISVDSPMTADDRVQRIAVFSERNPLANVARFEFGPLAGRATVSTRIRLGGSQRVHAVAECSDGKLWRGSAYAMVTLAACVLG